MDAKLNVCFSIRVNARISVSGSSVAEGRAGRFRAAAMNVAGVVCRVLERSWREARAPRPVFPRQQLREQEPPDDSRSPGENPGPPLMLRRDTGPTSGGHFCLARRGHFNLAPVLMFNIR